MKVDVSNWRKPNRNAAGKSPPVRAETPARTPRAQEETTGRASQGDRGSAKCTPRPEATGLHRARKQAQQFSGWIVSPQQGFFLRNQGKHGEGHGHQLRANAPTGQPSGRRKPTRRA